MNNVILPPDVDDGGGGILVLFLVPELAEELLEVGDMKAVSLVVGDGKH